MFSEYLFHKDDFWLHKVTFLGRMRLVFILEPFNDRLVLNSYCWASLSVPVWILAQVLDILICPLRYILP